ncbi:MAG TPA: hypothetical protein VMA77_20060 [Solirubrobacteraceae bacterium]|nr:hypothetical protein [Solirubrobacteraceae bacterium]
MTGSAFNIGSQHAAVINNSAGDQIVYGGGEQLTINVFGAVSELRAALASAAPALSERQQREAGDLLDDVDAAVRGTAPDKPRVAGTLARLVRLLNAAGVAAGSIGALHQLVAWLGPAAASMVSL